MGKKASVVAVILSVIAVGIASVSLVFALRCKGDIKQEQTNSSGDIQYVLYLGTNDRDTNEPVYSPEEAKAVLKEELIKRMGGYTIMEANGGWIDDSGREYQEYTLVIYLSDTDINKVHDLCDILIEKFKQSSILIHMNETTTEFYAGK